MAMLVWAMFVFTGMVGPVWAADVAGQLPPYTVVSLTGEMVALHESRGRVTVLNIWATWCGPCRGAFPELEELRKAHADCGLTVIGVSVDGPRNVAKVRPYVAREGLRSAETLWEVYVVGPETSNDPSTWRTELNLPLLTREAA